jgi:hypothetical protein
VRGKGIKIKKENRMKQENTTTCRIKRAEERD